MMPYAMQAYAGGQLGAASIGEIVDRLVTQGKLRQIGTSPTLPAGVPEVTLSELQRLVGDVWYKKWWFWALAGTVVAGGAYVFIIRPRRRRK